ncbi:MAB_1171c family putative transporter [Streptomyces sp. NPDC007851]|uniref:MAB_1171c family putative transporter n=1 Tax=Streptomyces sp. NPDC007851 TaxID=3155008 RepID=UPI0033E55ECC
MTSLAAPVSAGLPGQLHISFWIPAAVLTAALAVKLPTIVRLRRDPLLRAVGGLLLLGSAVFVFCAPSTIAAVNRWTGTPNISAPWCYSLLTALGACCLLLIIAWRHGLDDRSAAARRPVRWVVRGYSAVIAALWILFLLADVPVERLRDLDTYYATTPFMAEEVLLYLLAHTVACVITSRLIWTWVRADGLDSWLRRGLELLGVGYVLNLVFDAAKLAAVGARWSGHDLDWLSTDLAPAAAALAAVTIAAGFVLPHTGQYLHDRWRVRRAHRELRPLYRVTRSVHGAGLPFALRATPELRLTRRETFIRDVLLPLARHIDTDLGRRSYEAALGLGHPPDRARALASAVTVLDAATVADKVTAPGAATAPDAVDPRGRAAAADAGEDGSDTAYLLGEIGAVSRALGRPQEVAAVRTRAALPVHGPSDCDPVGGSG